MAEFTLNLLQRRVLVIAVCALSGKHEEGSQAFIYCGGEGSTGKSRVIAALVRYIVSITAASGSAADYINNTTVHTALGLAVRGSRARCTEQLNFLQ